MDKKRIAMLSAVVLMIAALTAVSLLAVRQKKINSMYDVKPLTEKQLSEIDLDGIDKLMFVAHPDDETLWGGAHLTEGGYLVVCLTRGYDEKRKEEFLSVIEKSGNNRGIILDYPDKVGGERDDWSKVEEKIKKDIKSFLKLSDWRFVVTHNREGEYGHLHHVLTNRYVTEIYKDLNEQCGLYGFGKYYKKSKLPEVEKSLQKISDESLEKKEELLSLYSSQDKTVEGLSHMHPYEMWQKLE